MKVRSLFFLVLVTIGLRVTGQPYKKPVLGYSDLLKSRFIDHSPLPRNYQLGDRLLEVVLQQKSHMNFLVPIASVAENDTVISFYYADDLIKFNKKKKVTFFSQIKFKNSPIIRISKKEINQHRLINFDSVYAVMKNDIAVNTKKFNFDKFLEINDPSFCCYGESYIDQFKLVYYFFINGILITPDQHSTSIYFLS